MKLTKAQRDKAHDTIMWSRDEKARRAAYETLGTMSLSDLSDLRLLKVLVAHNSELVDGAIKHIEDVGCKRARKLAQMIIGKTKPRTKIDKDFIALKIQ